jgi:iron(III) transport system substrate-binding protein
MAPRWLLGSLVVAVLGGVVLAVWLAGAGGGPRVVLYCSQDEPFATAVLNEFKKRTGLHAVPTYDTEANKSVGLYQMLVEERNRPRCDVFWNNEILSMIRLQRQGLLEPYASPSARTLEPFPASARTNDDTWHAFATRARVLLIHTPSLPRDRWPSRLADLTKEEYRGKVALALPHHGTSATQAACLFEVLGSADAKAWYRGLKANDVQLAPGNRDVASWVAQGKAAVGITDTDDALEELDAGKPVTLVFPDREGGDNDRMGTLFIPNTVGILRGCPNPEAARKLVDYLLSEEIEGKLAQSAARQIPFRPALREGLDRRILYPPAVKPMDVDFAHAADLWDEVQTFLRNEFARP